jgi:hypothetical protein
MKLQITEEQLKTIINNLSEQVIPGKGKDPWQYKKNGNKYFVAKKNTNSWKEVFGDVKIAVQKVFGGKKEDEKVVRNPKDLNGVQVADSISKQFLNKLDPKKLKTNSSVPIFNGGQPECAQFVNDFLDNIGYVGNAWAAKDNSGLGKLVYSAFDNLSSDIKNKVINLWKKIDAEGGGVKSGPYLGEVNNLVSKIVRSYSGSNLKLGDVVGIYYPPSKYHEYAFYKAGEPYFILKGFNINNEVPFEKIPGKTITGGKGWGMNTHVGVVGAIKNGVPLIFHNIHGQVYADPPSMLHDGGKIAWVRRP